MSKVRWYNEALWQARKRQATQDAQDPLANAV